MLGRRFAIGLGCFFLAAFLCVPISALAFAPRPQPDILCCREALPRTMIFYPTDLYTRDYARSGYADGQMRLVVPRLGLDSPVLADVEPDTLERGIGLYPYAKLPSWGNPNVSIAGHRDIFGAPFLDIDKLCDGDMMFLAFNGRIYRYRWFKTRIVAADDWSVVLCSRQSLLTLTSCDPVGSTQNRIVAIGVLEQVSRGATIDIEELGIRCK